MTTDAVAMAKAVVLDGLREDAALFVALQYLGMIDGKALRKHFADELNPEPPMVERDVLTVCVEGNRVEEVPVRWNTPIQTMKGSPFQTNPNGTVSYVGKKSQSRSLFAAWMEKEIAWTPAVFGWEEGSPEAELMRKESGQ